MVEGSRGDKIKPGQAAGCLIDDGCPCKTAGTIEIEKPRRSYAHHLQVCMIVPSSELDMTVTWGEKRGLEDFR